MHRCSKSHVPSLRRRFWKAKLERNRQRDRQNRLALRRLGWRILTVWECQTEDVERLALRIKSFLRSDNA